MRKIPRQYAAIPQSINWSTSHRNRLGFRTLLRWLSQKCQSIQGGFTDLADNGLFSSLFNWHFTDWGDIATHGKCRTYSAVSHFNHLLPVPGPLLVGDKRQAERLKRNRRSQPLHIQWALITRISEASKYSRKQAGKDILGKISENVIAQ